MTTNNYTRAIDDLGRSAERLRAERDKDPALKAMFEALQLTADEQAALDAAQEAVTAAEVAVNAAGMALNRAQRGMAPTYDIKRPFGFFQKSPGHHKAAAEAATPGLSIDLEEARTRLQMMIRRRNDTAHRIERARHARRRSAKLELAPKRQPVQSQNRGWNTGRGAA